MFRKSLVALALFTVLAAGVHSTTAKAQDASDAQGYANQAQNAADAAHDDASDAQYSADQAQGTDAAGEAQDNADQAGDAAAAAQDSANQAQQSADDAQSYEATPTREPESQSEQPLAPIGDSGSSE